jgi:integrase
VLRIKTDGLERYVQARPHEGAAAATINLELGLLGRAFNLAIRAKRLGRNRRPFLPKLAADETRVRQGFFTRDEVDALCEHLPGDLADVVRFLFFSAWRVGEVRTLEWRDYDRREQVIRLRAEHSKNKRPRALPVVGEIASVLERRLAVRQLDCPYIFHRAGQPVGDFRKAWQRACEEIGLAGRIVHDLRRSGVKHLIDAGVDRHTVMRFSGHVTESMLRRYHIIDVADLRRAAERASTYAGPASTIRPLASEPRTPTEREQFGRETGENQVRG